MRKSTLSLAVLLACLCLTSCAPVILGRTPQPAAPGEWESSLNAGYPILKDPFSEPIQLPIAQPANLFLSRGVGGNTEVNSTLSLSYGPSLRLGGKTLLVGGTLPVAVDYGVSLPLDIGFDAGLLFSYPQPGVEPYGALRGFATSVTTLPGLSGALTVGADIPAGTGNFFVEVTAHTTTATDPYAPQPPLGFSIVPALGYRF